jgi:hypothetical protein
MGIRLVHVGWYLTIAIVAFFKLNVSLFLRFAIRSLLNLNEVVKNSESSAMSNDLFFGNLNLGGGNETE